jgi:hypothetical protein
MYLPRITLITAAVLALTACNKQDAAARNKTHLPPLAQRMRLS